MTPTTDRSLTSDDTLVGLVDHVDATYEVHWSANEHPDPEKATPATITLDGAVLTTLTPTAGGAFSSGQEAFERAHRYITEGGLEEDRVKSAARVIAGCWPNGRGIRTTDAVLLARALADAGHLKPDLPVVCVDGTEDFVTTFHSRIGCTAPVSEFASQIIVIHGDEDASDVTLDFSDKRLTAITPDKLDSLIACLLAARQVRDHHAEAEEAADGAQNH